MQPKKDGIYAMYLRKSRADIEAEKKEKFETLARHEQLLSGLASRYGIRITKIYRELVSGDTIEARPEIKVLLSEVRAGVYDGVLVTEISRLARGNTIDQGVVSEAFRASGTLILTPSKIYDPADESDETFFDFELFMSRQEYKYIKKRMERGRKQSFENGNWIFPHIPTGYRRQEGSLRLIPDDNAGVMRSVLLDLAAGRKKQSEAILFLQSAIPERKWHRASAKNTLLNPIYAGYMKRGRKSQNAATYNPDEYVPANCEPLISLQDHERIIRRVIPSARVKAGHELRNAFAGLIRCSTCGYSIVYADNHGHPTLKHQTGTEIPKCNCVGINYEKARSELLGAILAAIPYREQEEQNDDRIADTITDLQEKLAKAERIKQSLFENLENGLYTAFEFRERKNIREQEIEGLKRQINALKRQIKRTAPIVVSTNDLKDAVLSGTPAEANELLKILVDHIDYARPSRNSEPVFTVFFR